MSVLFAFTSVLWLSAAANASCANPANAIEAENCLPGNPSSQWDLSTPGGDSSIQGFATDISYNVGQTVTFKISTPATGYHLDIYRMGYYNNMGARLVATVTGSGPSNQPACQTTPSLGLVDCGNWTNSSTWTIPSTAVSGIYFVKLIRNDTAGASHMIFIVRNDASTSALLFQASDTTWQAYNDYGGANLYSGGPGPQGGAFKVSYNRPFHTRAFENFSWVFNAEYPMIRWLEANGYDVTYFTDTDADRRGNLIPNHGVYLSVGHDEYWSGGQRANVEAARNAGTNLAFFSGNEIFWKTRWENNFRTLVTYKETHAPDNPPGSIQPTDPLDPPIWTGSWRDARLSPPADGGRPENALSGQIFMVNGPWGSPGQQIRVSQAEGQMRFWRNTPNAATLGPGQTHSTPAGTLGYEWDMDLDNGARPPGSIKMSTATYSVPDGNFLLDNGSNYGTGTAIHNLTLYKHSSGALVFGAGTVHWAWGLDANHDNSGPVIDVNMQQATVNLFADMGVQPATLRSPLILATASTDTTPPSSTITSPAANSTVSAGSAVTISGTAADNGVGGVVGGVEVSTDGGTTWHPANGRGSWSYLWQVPNTSPTATLMSRATDDSGNIESPPFSRTVQVSGIGGPQITNVAASNITINSATITWTTNQASDSQVAYGTTPTYGSFSTLDPALVTSHSAGLSGLQANTIYHYQVLSRNSAGALSSSGDFTFTTGGGGTGSCPCTIWPASTVPGNLNPNDPSAVELGVKFTSDQAGTITGIRFYKGPTNTGTHVGNLWTSAGVLLATATFSNESSSGWQQVSFSQPVNINANTTYVASYHTNVGQYAFDANYFASATNNPPLHALASGVSGGNGVYIYGPSAFPNQTFQATNYWVDVVFVPSGGTDITPPTVTSVNPAANAGGVSTDILVSATFSEPMTASTITGNTFQLRNGTTLVNATVTYSSENRTARLQPAAALAAGTTYTATVVGSTGGVADLASNVMTSNFTWSFTTAGGGPPPGPCPCTIWPVTTVPANLNPNDPNAIELGLKFTSEQAGNITGIRFYKGTLNSGTHVGNLWTSAGSLLATATFINETASGWQQVNFSQPVAINANTTYVASYHTNAGQYAFNANYFAVANDNPPLHALASGSSGGNGVYVYGPSAFPTQTFQATNYWVDVVFAPSGSDTTPPTVTTVSPPANAGGVSTSTSASATFNEGMTASTINSNTFQLRDDNNNLVTATVTYNNGANTATLQPSSPLASNTTYTATVSGGTGGVADLSSNVMTSNFTWSFTTAAPPPPPPPQGPGGPILVVTSTADPFTTYLAEILRNEGFNEFATSDITNVNATTLSNSSIVILGRMSLTSAQVSMFTTWVNGGGRLIAMRPDKQFASLLGLTDAGGTRADAYLGVNTASGPGVGIVDQSIQYHGTADFYTLNGAISVASLFSNASTSTANPAVTMNNVGGSGGQAAAFTYDLARSVALTRQGNPAWSGQERDGASPIRSDDLYFGGAVPDYVDLTKVAIPQADEQMRLLANMILSMNNNPLPRFWYLPSGFRAAVVMTGDDHAQGGTAGRFNQYAAVSPAGCSLANWECVRSTSYLFPGSPLTATQAASYTAQGFEVGMHLSVAGTANNNCADFTSLTQLNSIFDTQLSAWQSQYSSVPAPNTVRTHCITWSDWSSHAQADLSHGIRLDTNYYYWPGSWLQDRPGFFTGSGMPMRFVDPSGNMIDVYQATTQMTDESDQSYPATINALLDNAIGPLGYYGVFTANMHTDSATSPGSDAILSAAQSRGVPIVSAKQMLTWIDGRNGSSFGNLSFVGNTLSFSVTVGSGATNLTAMLPMTSTTGTLSNLTRGGTTVSFTPQTIKGVQYAMFSATPGIYQAVYGGGPPTVTLSSVSLNPTTVTGGAGSTGTVTLSGVAPAGGAVVTLSSSNTAVAQVPASVNVAAGATTATFAVTTSTVAATTQITITGNFGVARTATLTVNPVGAVTLSSVTLNPTTVTGGNNSTGTVTLSGAAPTGGAVVTLSDNSAAAQVPASVTVAAGATTANFTVTTSGVASSTQVTITGTLGVAQTATLTVTPATLTSLTVSPTTVTGGANSTGTVTLNGNAPTGGAVVTLSDNNAAATVPASVTVAAGARTATFTVTTTPVAANTSVVITGTLGVARTATLTVNAATLSTITRTPTTVVGGSSNSTGTVTLNGAAPAGGALVTVSSSNTAAAQVPASVTVAAGSTSTTFTITTSAVPSQTSVTITAVRGTTRTTTLTVNPWLSSVTKTPNTLVGGNNSTGTVTLAAAAPAGGALVTLSSSNTTVAQVPASVTVAAGSTTATFTITTTGVASQTIVTISAVYLGNTRTTNLTVNPASVTGTSLVLNPTTVNDGSSSLGTVTLNGAAPPAGAVITVTSSNTARAQVPASITIPAGARSGSFTITTTTGAATTSTITVTYRGASDSATLTIQ